MPTKTKKPTTQRAKKAAPAAPRAKKAAPAAAPSKKPTSTAPQAKKRAPAARMTLAEAMSALEKAGTAQARKTYARHGAAGPMFGVSFAALKTLSKRIGVDHDLALALWETGNLDARNLAAKVVDPQRMSQADLDRWAQAPTSSMLVTYVAHVAADGPHGRARAEAWLAASSEGKRGIGWWLVGALAMTDEASPDAWFAARLAEIEKTIHKAPNSHRLAMNQAVIAIGCRSAALRKQAAAAAKRIGEVDVDHGDTECKTPDAAAYLEKAWAHSTSKGFESPAAHERSREPMRKRC